MDGADPDPAARPGRTSIVRDPQDAVAGLLLILVAGVALWLARDLNLGTMRSMGPGMAPTALAVMAGALGVLISVVAFLHDGPALERWHLRGPIFILGSVVLFALLIRTAGLAVAGPISILVGCLATNEARWFEAAIFSVAMTVFCVVLFKVILGLPIPVLLIG